MIYDLKRAAALLITARHDMRNSIKSVGLLEMTAAKNHAISAFASINDAMQIIGELVDLLEFNPDDGLDELPIYLEEND